MDADDREHQIAGRVSQDNAESEARKNRPDQKYDIQ
jgi:hypothetical protein